VECFHVIDSNPDPCSGLALAAAAEINANTIARNVSEVIVTPTGVLEAQSIYVEAETGGNLANA
jgi:hypothetical protein